MDAEQKKRLIDALFDEPGKARPAATADELRAVRILVETGCAHVKKPDASLIWRRHSETPPKQGRRLNFPRWIIPSGIAAAAAAITLVVFLRPAVRETAGEAVAVHSETLTYRQAAQVFINQASAYTVREIGDTIEISAQSLEARIDFTATSETKSVLITTPAAAFRIVGTSIAISATAEKATLHVAEGKVRVESKGQARLVTPGQVWSYENGHEIQRAETAADRGHFIQLGHGKPVPEPAMKAVQRPVESRDAEHKAIPQISPEKIPAKEPVPRAENAQRGSERGKSERTEKAANRDDRDGARSDRAAARAEREERRSEREARRSERQAAKAERHK